MKIILCPIGKIKPYPGNPRVNDQAVQAVAASIKEYGFRNPIIVDSNYVIIAGHTRYKAAIFLMLTEVPVHVAIDLTPAQVRAYRIADNKTAELAEWDTDLLAGELVALQEMDVDLEALGFTEDELDELLGTGPTEGLTDPDEVPESPTEPITKPGDLWLLGDHRVLCGDATKAEDVARVMDGKYADCIFTSPPYAVGIEYGIYEDTFDNLRALMPKLAQLWISVIVDGGFAVINFGDIAGGRIAAEDEEPCEYPMALQYWPIFRDAGWRLWTRRVWCKPNARVHAPWTIQSNRAATDWEHIWTWVRPGKPLDIRNGAINRQGWFDTTKDEGVEIKKDVHGAGMATGCAVRMLQVHSRANKIVYEPLCGTGTTLIAAAQLGRKCYSMEIEPKYCDVIVQRWENFTGRKAELEA